MLSVRLLSLLLIGSALAAMPSPLVASAQGSQRTCRGERATVIGEHRPDGRALGTPGRDVIVTNGARYVRAAGGDDLICVTNSSDFPRAGIVYVNAAGGNDRVVVTGSSRRAVWATLGGGADRFTGGPGNDKVRTGSGDVGSHDTNGDNKPDIVSTGRGNDLVQSKGSNGLPDRIDLGDGNDIVEVLDPGPGQVVVKGGTGRNELAAGQAESDFSEDLAVDSNAGTATRDGSAWIKFSGFQAFRLDTGGTLTFRGDSTDERVHAGRHTTARTIATGLGDDVVSLGEGLGPNTLDGGLGDDRLELSVFGVGGSQPLVVDVEQGSVTPSRSGVTFTNFNDVFVSALSLSSITLRGSEAADVLSVTGCEIAIEGRGGNDRMTSVRTQDGIGDYPCSDSPTSIEGPAHMDGGAGDDILIGGAFDDHLDGGEGNDSVDGGAGTDTCAGESEIRCEQ